MKPLLLFADDGKQLSGPFLQPVFALLLGTIREKLNDLPKRMLPLSHSHPALQHILCGRDKPYAGLEIKKGVRPQRADTEKRSIFDLKIIKP